MKEKEMLQSCLDALQKQGAEKVQCVITNMKKYEMNVEGGAISLLRTTLDKELDMSVIKNKKKGNISINKTDEASIEEAIKNVLELSETSEEDESYDISPRQEPKEFITGHGMPDLNRMYTLLKTFVYKTEKFYPQINLMNTVLEFNLEEEYFMNSNGVYFKATKGVYDFGCMFAAKEGEKSSSFNYSSYSLRELEKDLMDYSSIENLLRESVEQLNAKPLKGKFVGDVIITPDCLNDVIDFYIGVYLSDQALIAGTSALKDKLNEMVAHPKFTLHSKPASEEIANGYFITPDGFVAENMTIVNKGVLNSFMLSLYGSKKTGNERAANLGHAYIVEGGDVSLKEIIKKVDRGIVIGRFSGGNPSSSGEFSGVAKNSYYVENGEIKYPINETMISGNLLDIFKNIKEISNERIDFGRAVLPWVCTFGITISGK